MMDSAEELGEMFESMLKDAFSHVHSRINEAYAKGWKPAEDWVLKLADCSCPSGEDLDVWRGALFNQFCDETSFPEEWTLLEKRVLFNQLLFGLLPNFDDPFFKRGRP